MYCSLLFPVCGPQAPPHCSSSLLDLQILGFFFSSSFFGGDTFNWSSTPLL